MYPRKQLIKEKAKGFVMFKDYAGDIVDEYIYYKDNELQELEGIKQYAIEQGLDILHFPHTISLSPHRWQMYYTGRDTVTIQEVDTHQMTSIFLDIDSDLYENYQSLKEAVKCLPCSVKMFESAGGGIHLYLSIKKCESVEMYRRAVSVLVRHFKRFNLEVDANSISPMQVSYLEGFRVLAKHGISSRYYEEFSKGGGSLTAFELVKRFTNTDYKTSEAMDILHEVIHNRVIPEATRGCNGFNLHAISRMYSIPSYTLSKALRALQIGGAVSYSSVLGCKGGVRVHKIDNRRWRKTRREQLTRKSNFYFINMMACFHWCLGIIGFISECCKYIEKGMLDKLGFIRLLHTSLYTQGLLSGSSGSVTGESSSSVDLGLEEMIQIGERNTILVKRLVNARYKGLDLERVCNAVLDRMVQTAVNPFTYKEAQAVLRWVKRIELHT